jgi:hypothetical protein
MIGAPSYIDAPEVTVPLKVRGWHSIRVGYWNPPQTYDGMLQVKVKLDNDPAYQRIWEFDSADTQHSAFLREAFFKCANLTGRSIRIAKSNGALGRQAFVAYVKLTPLSAGEVRKIQRDRAVKGTRNLTAAIDAYSYFHRSEYSKPEHVLELIEPFRHSDVGTVLWAANYGDKTNYPSNTRDALYLARPSTPMRFLRGTGPNPYAIGEKNAVECLRAFARKGLIPQDLIAGHAHSMGLRLCLMFRLGILGHTIPELSGPRGFVHRHPQWRQKLRNGTIINKASYAFPEVRQFMLSLIRESVERFDVDGANLCFVRGPHFLWYEQPILDAFRDRYGQDARKIPPTDPRLWRSRAQFMTEFVQEVRKTLDELGRKKRRHLELSVWVWPGKQTVWLGRTPMEEGLDVGSWIRNGLLDAIICQEGIDRDWMKLCRRHDCRFELFTGYRGRKAMSPRTITKAYRAGVDHFAWWDLETDPFLPERWAWIRRIGHREEIADWDPAPHRIRRIRLKKVAGVDVSTCLAASEYSGG